MNNRTAALVIGGGILAAIAAAVTVNKEAREYVGEVVDEVTGALHNLISQFEGFSPTAYQDVAGYWTIGYGHLIQPGEPYHPYGAVTEITREEGQALLERDTEKARQAVDDLVSVPLTPNQHAALVSFVFNVGRGAFQKSTLLRKLNAADYDGAANELDKWVHAGGQRVAGLERRRQLEKETFLA